MQKSYYVYILKCRDNSYYVGITNDLYRRIFEHESGYDPDSYTFNKRPVKLMFYEVFNWVNDAITFEKQLKGWNRRKKEALIKNNWKEIVRLSKKIFCKKCLSS